MPRLPLPPELDEVVARANPAVVATVRPDGAPHTAATWYDWETGRVLLNMDETRARLWHTRPPPGYRLGAAGTLVLVAATDAAALTNRLRSGAVATGAGSQKPDLRVRDDVERHRAR